ncbi:MAG: hypothetical protein PF904_07315 [Kiritimatiellae bacterium]|jgi:hypothetical protein|nr:hypothetical protein [Kiritimatiellia bacterium]
MKRKSFIKLSFSAGLALPILQSGCASTSKRPYLYQGTDTFNAGMQDVRKRGLALTDFHIHIRGGMTPEKAAARETASNIKSAVLENFGREWPLKSSSDLAAFIDTCKETKVNNTPLPVGIQVNDRDWYKLIDRKTFERLDYVLADTMIMGLTAEGNPRRLWKDDVIIDNPQAWMDLYLQHNLRILDEPVTILANPTYLPKCIANLYDELWSDERMQKVIAKSIQKKVALEVQAESHFPQKRFLKIAKSMGAVFSFGSNNFTDKTKDPANWFNAIQLLNLQQENLLTHPKKLVYQG